MKNTMTQTDVAARLERLKGRERQLMAQRQALEAKAIAHAKRRETRQLIALGRAVLSWMSSDDMARAALPRRLQPFIAERDRTVVDMAFSDVIDAVRKLSAAEQHQGAGHAGNEK